MIIDSVENSCTSNNSNIDITTPGIYIVEYSYTHNDIEYTYNRYVFIYDNISNLTLYYRKEEEEGVIV